jgi:hypothetical protein
MLRSLRISGELWGEIYFLSRRYRYQAAGTKRKIRDCCRAAAEGDAAYERAIFAFMCTGAGWRTVCRDCGVSDGTLIRLRKRYVRAWIEGGDYHQQEEAVGDTGGAGED